MFPDFPVEFFGQYDQVLTVARKVLLVQVFGIPDSRLAHEIEPGLMHHRGDGAMGIGSEEDGGAEDTLEGTDQATVLGSTLLHAERFQHFGSTRKCNLPRLLPGGQGGEKERDKPILPPGKSIIGVTGDEQNELAVTTFVDQGSGRRTFNGEAAEDKGARRKTQILAPGLATQADAFDGLQFPKGFGGRALAYFYPTQDLAGSLETGLALGAFLVGWRAVSHRRASGTCQMLKSEMSGEMTPPMRQEIANR